MKYRVVMSQVYEVDANSQEEANETLKVILEYGTSYELQRIKKGDPTVIAGDAWRTADDR